MASFSEQSKDQQGYQNHWLLNKLPQGRSDSTSSIDSSPIRNRENSESPHPNLMIELQKSSPQQKPVNLLPEVPMQTPRKLSEREQRDCDVIGMNNKGFRVFPMKPILYSIYLYTRLTLQRD